MKARDIEPGLVYCPQCGTPQDSRYKAALCCDVRQPDETEDEQLYRLFKDEIDERVAKTLEQEDAKAAPKLCDPPLDIEALTLRFRPGDIISVFNGDKYYHGKRIELHSVDKAGIAGTFVDEPWPINTDGLKVIHCFGWPAINHYLDNKKIRIEPWPSDKVYTLHPRLSYIEENRRRNEAKIANGG